MARLPLEGIRILDFTLVWAGPYGTMFLADWGAEVIRVESTQYFQPSTRGGSASPVKEVVQMMRGWGAGYPNYDPGDKPFNRYPIFQSHARNKLSMTVDVTKPKGNEIFFRLLKMSDVYIENNVPETIEKLGLTYDVVRRVKEDIIMVQMPAYGLSGPHKNYRSLGAHLDGTVGHTWLRGYPDMDPSMRGDIYLGDSAAGVAGAFAVAMALRYRNKTGKGQHIEMAQVENLMPYVGEALMDYGMNGRVQGSLGNRHPYMAPHGCYRCRGEDRWVAISVTNDEQWQGLCRALGNPAWTQEKRFSDAASRWHNQDDMDDHIQEWTKERENYEVMRLLQAEGVAAGPVIDDRDAFSDPHFKERGFFQELTHPDCGTHLYPGLGWKASKTPNCLRRHPVCLGEDNEYVYKTLLGVSDEEYAALEREGHIGTEYAPHVS